MSMLGNLQEMSMPLAATTVLGGVSLVLLFFFLKGSKYTRKNKGSSELASLPKVRGLPIVGNLLQLKEKKPLKAFKKWAEIYGPIHSIRTGASTAVVLNSADLAKEAMVTRYSSISTRNLSSALQILTANRCMVATSDCNEFYKIAKRYILAGVLGANAQKRLRRHQDTMIKNLSIELHARVNSNPLEAVNFRKVFENQNFVLALKEVLGREVKSIYVDELEATLSKEEIYKALVTDIIAGAIEVDWRDFFPYLRWIPNKQWEKKIRAVSLCRNIVTKAMIREQKQQIASGEESDAYIDFLISEGTTLTEEQIAILLWEAIIETTDSTTVLTEWALYELAKDAKRQNQLYEEIEEVCGSERVTEDHLSQLPYLAAVFHETLRKYSPVPVVPLRYVHEDTQLGGYFVPAGSRIAINIYGCNMDKQHWEDPENWTPERFLDERYDLADLYKTMSFRAGKRACAGACQVMLVYCTAIGRLVQEFEWRVRDDERENVDMDGLTTHKLHPMQAMLKLRGDWFEVEEIIVETEVDLNPGQCFCCILFGF
ncbi:ent-kaurene oxidase, chloroplastic-like [Syzygium oleosum]|uniref:ent-kaurene oxidase, chloroplastic-like n=1 Tax=Syzygium oleosum TaxID=219896 RepID=UPI0011D24B7B|nr:ent-kaurene oxidase, chloroplastic-like [Syzygium oleosum]